MPSGMKKLERYKRIKTEISDNRKTISIMKTISLIIFCTVLIPSLVFAQNKNLQKPNIIIIMADDLGFGDVGFSGNQIIKTPELDKMASEALVFDRFYAAAPICSPTRASVLTGRNADFCSSYRRLALW